MSNPFEKPTTPKNSLQLLQWLIFEPILLYNYDESLILKTIFIFFVSVIVPLTIILYFISVGIIAVFDLPLIFPPDKNSEEFLQQWQSYSSAWDKGFYFISVSYIHLAVGLVIGLVYFFIASLTIIVSEEKNVISEEKNVISEEKNVISEEKNVISEDGNSCFFTLLLILGLAKELFLIVFLDLGFLGLTLGLATGFSSGFLGLITTFNLNFLTTVLPFGLFLFLSLVLSLYLGLEAGLSAFFAFIILFYITYFRIWLYPWYLLKSFFSVSLTKNPYIDDAVIWLPIWGMKNKLTSLAQQDPKTALDFVRFLLQYRPLQRQLAMHITHAAIGGYWKVNPLKELEPPPKIEETSKLTPSQEWFNQIDNINEQLTAYDEEENITLKKNQFETLYQELEKSINLTLNQSPRWNHYYIPAIKQWLRIAKEKLDQLTEEVKQQEPITHNIYRYGEILDPKKDKEIFFGRQDIKSELSRIIITSRSMPMFLFYGQRRVGKSSLLKFLPRLLGSRFKVIYQDFQSAKLDNLQNWLQDLRQQLDKTSNWQVSDNWLTAWQEMQSYLEQLTTEQQEKIILAFDEYEALHKNILQTQPEQGRKLLEAMRSFSQQQNQIVFLFVGSTQFVDLKDPNWDRCFIHARGLKIDYLNYEQTKQLITKPVQLDYPDTVIDYIFEMTQGYPALVQMLCSHIVDTANNNQRKNITLQDVEQIIKQHIIQRGTNALSTFWTEFCKNHQCKPAIHQLLNNNTISDQKALIKLEDYGYIIEQANGWKLRVPLLEQWLRRYKDVL